MMENTINKTRKTSSQKRNRIIANTAIYIILGLISIIWLLPFLYLLLQSLREEPGSLVPYIFPKKWTLDNYVKLFTDNTKYSFGKWYLNTFIISLVSCVIQTTLTLCTSYAFSRLRFKGKKTYMKLILVIGMFPGFMGMIATYQILKLLHLNTSVFSLILVYCASSAMGYYISKGYFDTIPYSLDEAAKIDGASGSTIFFRVIMPLAKPMIIYMLLTSFSGPWGDFMFASYIANGDPDKFNLAVGLKIFLSNENSYEYFTRFCAGSVVVSIPIVILFFILQRYYVEGITGGSVKG